MLNLFKKLFAKLKAPNSSDTNKIENQPHVLKVEDINQLTHTDHHQDTGQDTVPDQWVAYDENLLERARTQWQFGDWESLTNISRESLQHHPDRAKLALLVAAGHAQYGSTEKLQQFIRLAKDWGCSRRLISQVLISGVQNSLGCAAIAAGQHERAQLFFEQAVKTGMPGTEINLLSEARKRQQRKFLGVNAES
jgi:uncharacterized protein HemY